MEHNKGFIGRIIDEYKYFTTRPWSLRDVGIFWDSVEDYDDINDKLYPYFKRFTNSEVLLQDSISINYENVRSVLDIQTRSGRGTKFWYDKFTNASFKCVDFSTGLLNKAKKRLQDYKNIKFDKTLSSSFNLNEKFDFIICYETVEHVYDYEVFIESLSNHLDNDGVMILTCPNVSWEIIHWVTAIVGFNHSEGPHRFIEYRKLLNAFAKSNLKVVGYNTTIFLPFNHKMSIACDNFLMKYLPSVIKRMIMLRHSFILKKN